MNSEHDELLMSQLADGELPSDQVNELLLGVLGDTERQTRLEQILRLRNATLDWRSQHPTRPITVWEERSWGESHGKNPWWSGTLALSVGACGVLLLVYLVSTWIGHKSHDTQTQYAQQAASPTPDQSSASEQVTPEQMAQVAQVFALHESVTGPLAWYAADDQNIRLASAQGALTNHPPIALQLKFAPADSLGSERTLMIVCREQQPALIEVPAEFADQAGLRMYVDPRKDHDKVDVQYAIAVKASSGSVEDDPRPEVQASLSGRRRVGLTETPLGQIAMGDRLVNVEAVAWAFTERQP